MNRLECLREQMRQEHIDAFLVTDPANRRYFSGFTGTAGMLLITMEQAFLLTDFRYVIQAQAQAEGFEIVKLKTKPYETIGQLETSIYRLGFEGNHLTYSEYCDLQAALQDVEFISLPEWAGHLRSVKEESEIQRIRQAVRVADEAFGHILNTLKTGQTETEIALELEFFMRQAGASGISFDFIVASGWRSAMPHGVASSKKIARGELLTIDFGAIVEGYCSDITRTICLDSPSDRQKELYEIVLTANRAGIAAVKPGIPGSEADAAARKIIADAGYSEFFGHGLGHSVGLEIHEKPTLSPRETRLLEPGMVITVEPGIYLPDWGGIRIEDMVVVTKNGCEVLTQAPKEFIIVN